MVENSSLETFRRGYSSISNDFLKMIHVGGQKLALFISDLNTKNKHLLFRANIVVG